MPIAVVGAGRMGGALVRGWLAAGTPAADIAIVDPHPGEEARAAIEAGAREGADALGGADTVLMSVKPQIFAEVADDVERRIGENTLLVSIMAGTSLATLQAAFPGRPIVRAMPNTPASIGQGTTGLFVPDGVSRADGERAERLLAVSGPVVRVDDEDGIDRITAVSGSGPAYLFHLVEALSEAAQGLGFEAPTALALARQTVVGAARLLEAEGDPTALRKAVTSPNGTTQAALDVLMQDMPDLMERTVAAAYARAVELGKS